MGFEGFDTSTSLSVTGFGFEGVEGFEEFEGLEGFRV